MEVTEIREALHRIRLEYIEMPEMKLTLAQMRRLLNLPLEPCEVAVASLVDAGFLVRRQDGAFVRGPAFMSVVQSQLDRLAPAM